MIRKVKIILAVFVAAFCLMYALQNLVNLQAAYGFVALMAGMENHLAYPESFGPSVKAPALIWLMLWIIISLEVLAGAAAAKGAFDMWMARDADPAEFKKAKTLAMLGCGVAVIIWFGIFSAIGGAYFQMWQTEAGVGVNHQAFWFSVQMGLIWLILASPDE